MPTSLFRRVTEFLLLKEGTEVSHEAELTESPKPAQFLPKLTDLKLSEQEQICDPAKLKFPLACPFSSRLKPPEHSNQELLRQSLTQHCLCPS